ncbi:hypothetical protein [Flavobacterium aciduliphilum]|nr:hypothetical protein [Flavobacterium aciduliphilum]
MEDISYSKKNMAYSLLASIETPLLLTTCVYTFSTLVWVSEKMRFLICSLIKLIITFSFFKNIPNTFTQLALIVFLSILELLIASFLYDNIKSMDENDE